MEIENSRQEVFGSTGGRPDIDTRKPFRSVRDAVALFGEQILVKEIHANKIKEFKTAHNPGPSQQSKIESLTTELHETKQALEKTKKENTILSQDVKSLTEELEKKRREIQKLKEERSSSAILQDRHVNPEIEEIRLIEKQSSKREDGEEDECFDKRRLVRFASPPLLTREIVSKDEDKKISVSNKKMMVKKMKPLMPLFGWIPSRKREI